MTELTVAPPAEDAAPSKLKKLLPIILVVVGLIAGGAVGFLGIWSPLSLLAPAKPKVEEHHAPPAITYLELPRLVVTIPASPPRTLAMTAMVEVAPASLSQANLLKPRVLDAFTSFLTEIDPAAFDRRGILEIVRAELATRARFILGDAAVRDILITEYRLQ